MFRRKIKKKLGDREEFELLKIVIDKFLLVAVLLILMGIAFLGLGIDLRIDLTIFFGGIVILVLFIVIILAHYEVIW